MSKEQRKKRKLVCSDNNKTLERVLRDSVGWLNGFSWLKKIKKYIFFLNLLKKF